MRKNTYFFVLMLLAMMLFIACAQQEESASDNGKVTIPTTGLTEEIKPTLSPTPTNTPSPTCTSIPSITPELTQSPDVHEDKCPFEYELKTDGTIRITGVKDRSVSVVSLPETIEEKMVTEIGASAFAKCGNLTEIEIPTSVTVIGEGAFRACGKLQTVELSWAINSIGENAFEGCAIDSFVVSYGTYAGSWAKRNGYRVVYSDYDLEFDLSLNMYEITVDGESYSAVYGETGALIWKYVDATFDRAGYCKIAFISEECLPGMQLFDSEKCLYRTFWVNWSGIEPGTCSFISVGDDVFEKQKIYPTYVVGERIYINGKNGVTFSEYSMNIPGQLGDRRYKFDRMQRLNDFSDGYALMRLEYETTGNYSGRDKYCWVDTNGNMLDYIEFEEGYNSYIYFGERSYSTSYVGPYSDGVFYHDEKFLDLDLNVVLDLGQNGYRILSYEYYTPRFVDGVCSLIVYKNSKFWMFDIDKAGNTISEPEEIDILWLGY